MRVGVLGGGQLGLMLTEAAAPLGIDIVLVDPSTDLPPLVHGERVASAFDDPLALDVLSRCDVVTVELESVPVDILEKLRATTDVAPPPLAVAVSQDRLVEKQHFTSIGIPTVPYVDIVAAPAHRRARRDREVAAAAATTGAGSSSFARVRPSPATMRSSRIASRSIVRCRSSLPALVDGAVACYPVVENVHAEGILRRTIAPAPATTPELQALAEGYISALAESLDYVGVLALELFQIDGELVANEMAPRVHNTGHWTIEGAATSQFTQHLLAITGQPLGPVAPIVAATMTNLIGELPHPLPVGPGCTCTSTARRRGRAASWAT